MDDILRIEKVRKTYKSRDTLIKALDGVTFSLYRGEILAIMGSSGSGKSTLLNVIGGLERPDEGRIYINHNYEENYFHEPYASEFRNINIGFVYQAYNLLEDISVQENIEISLLFKRCKEAYIQEQVADKLKLVGLFERGGSKPRELSADQRQRVAIARAIATNPKILLADEPTGNLDYNCSIEIMNLLVKLNHELGQSMILVTHDPKIASYADRVLFFQDGKIMNEIKNDERKDNIGEILNVFQQQYRL